MRMSEVFPSNYLKSEDLEDGDLTVTIRDDSPVEHQEFTQKGKPTPDQKPVLYFKAPKGTKALVMNKTNWKTITEVLGSDDSDDWAGKQITLYATEVESFGEMTMAIRVRLRKPQAKAKSAASGELSVLEQIRKLTMDWPDSKQIGAEVVRQLETFNVGRIGELSEDDLPKLLEGLQIWQRKQQGESIVPDFDAIPFN